MFSSFSESAEAELNKKHLDMSQAYIYIILIIKKIAWLTIQDQTTSKMCFVISHKHIFVLHVFEDQ